MTTFRRLPRLALCLLLATSPAMAFADDAAAMRAALDRVGARDWAGAAEAAAPAGQVAQDIVEWHRLRAGEGLLGDYEAFLARRADWPGLPLLKEKGETAVARSTTPDRVIAYFGTEKPQTAEGALALIAALTALGRQPEAEAEAIRAWTELSFSAEEEDRILAAHGEVLKVAHEVRLDRLLWQDRAAEARRMLPRVSAGWRALAEARLALHAEADGVTALIEAVPQAVAADAGLAHARFVWRMKKDRTEDAAALILERSESPQLLGDPARWADRRANLARALLRDGKPREAYRIAARHHLTAGAGYADLEFLAGFIALRRLNDPATALTHFRHLETAVVTPISVSRAQYWQARALEAKGDADAAAGAYAQAARFHTAYYGLLAAEKLGLDLDPALVAAGKPADWRGAAFAGSSVFAAARLLLDAGDATLAKRFLLHLGEGLDGAGLGLLSDFALTAEQPHIALLVAKQAAERGIILPRAYFPTPDLVPADLPVSRALALSIARRESEFDPGALSQAGARGLMQVMPGTAKLMAEKARLPYEAGRLTRDPAYNVVMGTQYLRQLIDEFGPSIALVASGYNAGPGRPRRWIEQFGDPRAPGTDVVDWVEMIPFTETRTYVMRVVEGVVIYRARLKGATGPVRITAELKG